MIISALVSNTGSHGVARVMVMWYKPIQALFHLMWTYIFFYQQVYGDNYRERNKHTCNIQ